jgi:uncharacterized protein YkwD
MASVAAPAFLRVLAGACVVASVFVALLAGRADGAGRVWASYLAPAGTCAGESDARVSRAQKARAIRCLVNWARARSGRSGLTPRRALTRAAALKGHAVAECGDFSHTPCGTDLAAHVRATGYRFALFGENLFAGPYGRVSAREVVEAWLESPPHRANLLSPRYRELGIAPARAQGILGPGEAVLWTAAFAAPS